MPKAEIGIIGGTGLYQMDGLEDVQEIEMDTPFGRPSDAFIVGQLAGKRVAFLARHGRGHRLIPSEIPARANIYAFKALGAERLISISAVGSLREEIQPRDMVIPDQYFDRTRGRPNTLFGRGIAVHISFDEPACPRLSDAVQQAALKAGGQIHRGGTLICMEGPVFSTKAESRTYRQWGMDIIGMTALPEVKFAREAEICYVTLAFVTDYDVWHESEGPVTLDMILDNLHHNTDMAQRVIHELLPLLDGDRDCVCVNALASAIVTAPDMIPPEEKERLGIFLSNYVS